MPNKRSRLLLTVLGGSAVSPASFTVTTVGAATLTMQAFTVSASTVVDWGDGSSNTYTGSGTRTHSYAGAGTWTLRILQPQNVTDIEIGDSKFTTMPGSSFAKMINLTRLSLYTTGVVWTVGPSAPMPPALATLYMLNINYAGFSWTVGPSAPMPTSLTSLSLLNSADKTSWTIGAAAPLPTGLVTLVVSGSSSLAITYQSSLAACTQLTGTVNLSANGWTQAMVDAALIDVYAAAQSRTGTGGTLNLSGSNAAPSGTYEATCPPTTGKSAAYELINDSCGTIAAGETWTTITVTGGLP
jgi:hypothetical protein